MNHLLVIILALVMLLTRFPFTDSLHLFDASWAVFFILGCLSLPVRLQLLTFVGLSLFGWVIDIMAVGGALVGSYCMTPAYIGLPVAYAVLVGFGKWSRQFSEAYFWPKTVLTLVLASLGAGVAFIITNAFFFAGSGYFAAMSLAEYTSRVLVYMPTYVLMTQSYVMAWVILQPLVITLARQANKPGVKSSDVPTRSK